MRYGHTAVVCMVGSRLLKNLEKHTNSSSVFWIDLIGMNLIVFSVDVILFHRDKGYGDILLCARHHKDFVLE
jgi:hypothetical protein